MKISLFEAGYRLEREPPKGRIERVWGFVDEYGHKTHPIYGDISPDGFTCDSGVLKPFLRRGGTGTITQLELDNKYEGMTLWVPVSQLGNGRRGRQLTYFDAHPEDMYRFCPISEGRFAALFGSVDQLVERNPKSREVRDLIMVLIKVYGQEQVPDRYKCILPGYNVPPADIQKMSFKGRRSRPSRKRVRRQQVDYLGRASIDELADWMPSYVFRRHLTEAELRRPIRGRSV